MSSCQSFMATPPGRRRGGGPGVGLLRTIPAQRGHAPGSPVVCIPTGPSEWALLIPRRDPPALQLAPPGLAGPFVPPLPGQFRLVRVPEGIDPCLGLALLHYKRGHTLIYCPEDHIADDRTARKLSALGGQVIGDAAHPEPLLTIAPVVHSLLPASLHPAAAPDITPGREILISVCSDMITAELAAVLSSLWTAHAACLRQLGYPGATASIPRPAPAGDRPATAGLNGHARYAEPTA
jgi:hypothetical protein